MKDEELIRAWLAQHDAKVVAPASPPPPKKARQGFKRHRAAKALKAGGRLS